MIKADFPLVNNRWKRDRKSSFQPIDIELLIFKHWTISFLSDCSEQSGGQPPNLSSALSNRNFIPPNIQIFNQAIPTAANREVQIAPDHRAVISKCSMFSHPSNIEGTCYQEESPSFWAGPWSLPYSTKFPKSKILLWREHIDSRITFLGKRQPCYPSSKGSKVDFTENMSSFVSFHSILSSSRGLILLSLIALMRSSTLSISQPLPYSPKGIQTSFKLAS